MAITTEDPPPRPTRALLPAAGSGRRARPLTRSTPKCLLEVDGEALLARAVRTVRDQLGINEVIVITGEDDERVRAALSGYPGVSLSFVRCEDPSIG
ncbi:MAG: NTP transferase domain-containing protein, partial [Planctomycetota bacterium]|nr:NTP transferase domain-containing protein [Planctomycetota bacterium]